MRRWTPIALWIARIVAVAWLIGLIKHIGGA